jgi:hypothetical protein
MIPSSYHGVVLLAMRSMAEAGLGVRRSRSLIKVAGVDELAAALLSRSRNQIRARVSHAVGRINGGPDPSPWIISIDGAAAVMASCVGRALLGVDICRGLIVARVCGRKEVLEGLDGAGGPVRSVCARLQCNRAEAARERLMQIKGEQCEVKADRWWSLGWLWLVAWCW